MTRSEFVAGQRAYSAAVGRFGLSVLLAWFATLILPGVALVRFESAAWFRFLGLASVVAALACSPALHGWSVRRMRRHGLLCPACSKGLVGLSGQITVATGRCGFCGALIFENS